MRSLYLAAGIFSVGMAAVGIALPFMPTVPFLIMAVFFFARSNPEWEHKIMHHPTWGPQIRDWMERRAINRRAKIVALAAMGIGCVFSWAMLGAPYYYVSIAIMVIAGGWIATRNE